MGSTTMYDKLCDASKDDWKSQNLSALAQSRQEDWFGLWVSEMVRIAKPGTPVIVENVAPPYCVKRWDWGGVNRDFWTRAIDTYGWDVDRHSLAFQDDTAYKFRYHVAMRKKKKEKK